MTLASFYPGGPEPLVKAFTARTAIDVKVNTVDAAQFQDQIVPYLSESPEDVISWGAARTRRVAGLGLATPIDDVWETVRARFPENAFAAATAADHHQYFMPVGAYGWVVFYRPDVFEEKGYQVPRTWTSFVKLAIRMQGDGLIPLALGDAEVFEADGLFDILDMRLNGCQFHLDLMAGVERWTDQRVRRVFERWRELMPFIQPGAVGRPFLDAIQALVAKRAGMYFMGSSIVLANAPADGLDIFPFPFFGNAWDAERALDVPTDGFMITRNSPTLHADLDNAKAFMEFLAGAEAQTLFSGDQPGSIALARDADRTGYNAIQHSLVDMISSAQRVSEFLDRDSDAGFAYQVGFALQDFVSQSDLDIGDLLARIQASWDNH